MDYYHNYLKLIKLVNDNYSYISQLEVLENMFSNLKPSVYLTEEEIFDLLVVCKTTHNSHYDYTYYTDILYKDPFNHIDSVIEKRCSSAEA